MFEPVNTLWFSFADLTTTLLYDVLALRQRVFVVEQSCAYLDVDGLDCSAEHQCVFDADRLVAYLRIVSSNKIGRVVVAPEYRGRGLARQLMVAAIERIKGHDAGAVIYLSAQVYLVKFYESLGFVAQGEPYDEDGILHVDMQRPA